VILPNGPQIAAARELIKENALLIERLRAADADVSRNEGEIAEAEAELAQIGEPGDTHDLAALLAGTRSRGDPIRLLSDLQARLHQENGRLGAALAKVPLWDQGVEALVAIVPPAEEMIDRATTAVELVISSLSDAEREIARLRRDRDQAVRRDIDMREGKSVPDAESIRAARAHRNLGWSLIRRSSYEGEKLDVEISAYAEPLGMTATFERAIRDADDLADRRDEESARLAAIAECERLISQLDAEINAAEERLEGTRQQHESALEAWATLTKSLCLLEAPEPGDLREFLAARDAVLDRRADRENALHAVVDEEGLHGPRPHAYGLPNY
jgi:hypothetical protein